MQKCLGLRGSFHYMFNGWINELGKWSSGIPEDRFWHWGVKSVYHWTCFFKTGRIIDLEMNPFWLKSLQVKTTSTTNNIVLFGRLSGELYSLKPLAHLSD